MSNPNPDEPTGQASRAVSPRLVAGGVIAVIALTFVFQNTAKREVNVLFWDITVPMWVWFLVLLVAGVVVGSLYPWFRRKKD